MKRISDKVIIALIIAMLFTMTSCKNKKQTIDSTEGLIENLLSETTVQKENQGDLVGEEETTELVVESQMQGVDKETEDMSNTGNKRPSGTSGNQGQTGSVNQGQSGSSGNQKPSSGGQSDEEDMPKYPWELGGKQPSEYTWEEYLALSLELKTAFLRSFSDEKDFERWRDNALKEYNTVEQPQLDLPWEEEGAKQPSEYTWEEFEALSPELQMAFQKSFASIEEFNAWMQRCQENEEDNQPSKEKMPWEEEGAKQPSEYTWAEFEALTADQQMAFQESFASSDDFMAWMENAKENDSVQEKYPWEEEGAKQPSEYSWAEFEALTADQQMAFQRSFASIDDFMEWLEKAQENASVQEKYPWEEEGAKQPSEYSWAEFEALTADQQMAFQRSFASIDDFMDWLENAQENTSVQEKYPWEEEGAKQPSEYTWAEFEALTADQQMAFQRSFASVDDFMAWLENAQENNSEQ